MMEIYIALLFFSCKSLEIVERRELVKRLVLKVVIAISRLVKTRCKTLGKQPLQRTFAVILLADFNKNIGNNIVTRFLL